MVARLVTSKTSRAKAIMVLGTGSHVGKSLLVTALCRILAQHGVRVAPFKSQNMSLNSAATPDGLEIGRAQALQAEAAGVPASVDMNPVLIKPSGNMTSQIVVRGQVWGQLTAAEYHRRRVEELIPIIQASYDRLAAEFDVIVLEGAGSPAEINLKQHDIVNMRMAEMADAACVLVGDIDRGGVFASLLGTVELLDPHEQVRIRGFIVNKFRGDVALLEPGLRMMEERLSKPCLGVVGHVQGLTLDEEDSLGLGQIASGLWLRSTAPDRPLRIAVVALPSLSNFTDFDALAAEPSVELRLVRTAVALAGADLVLLPGSKETASDLTWLRQTGLATEIHTHAQKGLLAGICGGMQMLGRHIADPLGMEGGGTLEGLGLLDFATVMRPRKTTVLAHGMLAGRRLFGQPAGEIPVQGYEIHIGQTVYEPGVQPFAIVNGYADGCVDSSSRIFGSYLHGLFDADAFRHTFLQNARAFHGLAPWPQSNNWRQQREDSLNAFAAHVEAALELETIFAWAGVQYRRER